VTVPLLYLSALKRKSLLSAVLCSLQYGGRGGVKGLSYDQAERTSPRVRVTPVKIPRPRSMTHAIRR